MRAVIPIFLLLVLVASCRHQVEAFSPETPSDFLPLQAGKYWIYQLDSTVFTNFGRNEEVRSYQEKHVVDTTFADNTGRTSFRVYRFLRDSAGTQSWSAAGTYFITPTKQVVEVVEDNRRIVRLAAPLLPGFTWSGNRYLPDDTYEPAYNFSNDNIMDTWEYTYGERGTETFNGTVYTDVLPVYHADEGNNVGPDNRISVDTAYGYRSFSMDKYAKGIGLVYQELVLWEHETGRKEDRTTIPWRITFAQFYKGFGVKRTLLEHN
jgi:hypothetical protein